MKKIYIKPTSEKYEMEMQGVIAQSYGTSVVVSEEDADDALSPRSSDRYSWGSLWKRK